MNWERRVELQLAEIERKIANVVRVGRVAEVDAGKGLVRVEIAKDPQGNPVLSPWLPWTERAGGIRTWSPPSVGEQVMAVAPSGEIAQGWVTGGGFSNANGAPSNDGAAHVLTIGSVKITVTGSAVSIEGDFKVRGNVDFSAGHVRHNGTAIDDTHKHSGVMPGPAETGTPV